MNRRERKKEETRIKIIDCSIQLFKDKGFANTSMEEIAEKSDVAKGTLYNYFPDKESILASHFQLVIEDYKEEIKINIASIKGIKNKLLNLIEFISEIFNTNSELTAIYFRYRLQNLFVADPLDKTKRSGIETVICEVILDGQKENELRKDVPVEILSRNLQFLILSFLISCLAFNSEVALIETRMQIIDLFLNGAKI